MRIAVVMDPIQTINIKKDTTFVLLLEAQKRGHELWYCTPEHFFFAQGHAQGTFDKLHVHNDAHTWFTLSDTQVKRLADFDTLLMRKDPPFDMNYIYSTYFLDHAKKGGCRVINDPQSLRNCNEKLFTTWFPQHTPETLITSSADHIRAFHAEHQDIICKPLDGMGGASIFRVTPKDSNLNVIIETLTEHGKTPCMVQRFLPEITQGDKRILMINGEPVPFTLARIPAKGETRGNLAAGGRGEVRPLTPQEKQIAEQIGPELKARGLFFVGLDMIGHCITEINVTSPTCVQEITQQSGYPVVEKFFDVLGSVEVSNV